MSAATSNDLILKKKVSFLNREANFDYKEIFVGLGKAAAAGITGDTKGMIDGSLDAMKGLGIHDSPENAAWQLVSLSLYQALFYLVEDYKNLFCVDSGEDQIETFANNLVDVIDNLEVSLDASFFENTNSYPLLDNFKPAIVAWLESMGLKRFQAESVLSRLDGQFAVALHEQWTRDPETYDCISQRLESPFFKASLKEQGWVQYGLQLEEQANARVFDEAFGLRDIYIPLRAYYTKKVTGKDGDDKKIKVVCDLHKEITSWVESFDKNDALRVVCGGPGCGKSSFSKVLSADLVKENVVRVLFVPLHLFNLSDDLIDAVGRFVQYEEFIIGNPLDIKEGEKRLLIVFDGLDELSVQGKASEDVAQQFVDEVIRTLGRHNSSGSKWQVLITGRELSIQVNESRLRKLHQVLHVLPFKLTEDELNNFDGEKEILCLDQRDIWWEKFGSLNGKGYIGLPEQLSEDYLLLLTREPLLNYLISLSYERNKIEFNESTNLNSIYFDLLTAVYERQYAGRHASVKDLEFDEFMLVLEEVALTVWHGNGRTASELEIYNRCKENSLTQYLESFSEDAKKGVVRLLTAFYFRQSSKEKNGDRIFEFTHKSFGEYLAAKRIVSSAVNLSEDFVICEKQPRRGKSSELVLLSWIDICGESRIDTYLVNFIRSEFLYFDVCSVRDCQYVFSKLLGIVVRGGLPIEKSRIGSFGEMLRQSRNSEESLLILYSICANITKERLCVDFGEPHFFGRWLKRMQEQRVGLENLIVSDFLDYLVLKEINLSFADLAYSKLSFSDFSGANLDMSFAIYSIAEEVNFDRANMERFDAQGTDFSRSSFRDTLSYHSNFSYTTLNESILTGADFDRADFSYSNLVNVVFNNAFICDSDFKEAILNEADFQCSFIIETDFSDSVLIDANFEYSKMRKSILKNSALERASFVGANLEDVNFAGANLKGADFENANLQGANLEGANLEGANLEGANLDGANLTDVKGLY